MDLITLGLGAVTVAMVPLGAVAKHSYNNEKRLTVLETNYANLERTLTDLRNEQRDQTLKLDRIVERVL